MTQHTALLSETQTADAMLRARARLVVPGGMWGHLNAARLPEGYPQFFASAQGCRVRDVDGREYIDFMCSWGPVLLGHRHPEVHAAAEAQPPKEIASTVRGRSWWNSPKVSSRCCRMPIGRSGPVRLEQSDRQRLCAGRRYRQRSLSRSCRQGVRHRLILVRHGSDGGRTGDVADRVRDGRARAYPRDGPAAARWIGVTGERTWHRDPPERPAADAADAVRG